MVGPTGILHADLVTYLENVYIVFDNQESLLSSIYLSSASIYN